MSLNLVSHCSLIVWVVPLNRLVIRCKENRILKYFFSSPFFYSSSFVPLWVHQASRIYISLVEWRGKGPKRTQLTFENPFSKRLGRFFPTKCLFPRPYSLRRVPYSPLAPIQRRQCTQIKSGNWRCLE